MSLFLLRLVEVFVALVVFDGLIVAFLALCNAVDRLWHRRRADTLDHFVSWEAELAESAREIAKRRHPAGGRDLS